jgi:hypothetical protein
MERLGSKLVDRIRLDQENGDRDASATVTALTPREGRVKR